MATKKPRLLHLINGLDFPDYEYQEYPKMVTDRSGTKVTVNSKDEEKALSAPPPQAPSISLHDPAPPFQLHPSQMTPAQREARLAEMQKEMAELEGHQTSSHGGQPTGQLAELAKGGPSLSDQQAGSMASQKAGQGASGVPVTAKAKPGDHAAAKAEAEALAQAPGGVATT